MHRRHRGPGDRWRQLDRYRRRPRRRHFGISLALQDVGRGFVNGVYILVERPFRIGDHVRVGAAEGRVEEVGIRLTTLRTAAGERIIVPNTVVFRASSRTRRRKVDRQKYWRWGSSGRFGNPGRVIASLRGTPHSRIGSGCRSYPVQSRRHGYRSYRRARSRCPHRRPGD